MALENAFSVQSSISLGRVKGSANSRGRRRIFVRSGCISILEIMVEEVKTQVRVSQVVKKLTNQIFNAITVKSMDIMHMSAERDNIIRTNKFNISQTTQITRLSGSLNILTKQ
jgi:hypothetical protein